MLNQLIQRMAGGQGLVSEQVTAAVEQLTSDQVTAELKADFLTALARKGETVEEIAAFAHALRALSIVPPIAPSVRAGEILDVCGTGGDRLNTFNISTTVAILAAAAGVTVAKHGNRAITSQAGSADVLEALGIPVELSPEEAAASLQQHGFAFFFAPKFHPAFKHIALARKLCAANGQRTIFNFLGPLLNPAHPTAQLVGVPRPELCDPIARVLQNLGVRRGMVVAGEVPGEAGEPVRYLDELSLLGGTTVAEFYQDRGFSVTTLVPDHFPYAPPKLADLAGGDRQVNARIVEGILKGETQGPPREAVLYNAGAALFVAGRAKSILEGWELADSVITSGAAWAKLQALRGR